MDWMNPFSSSDRLVLMMVTLLLMPASRMICELATSNQSGHLS